MEYKWTSLSQALHAIPAKFDSEKGEWLPLCIHSIDTAGIMKHLVEEWLPTHVKRDLCRNIDPEIFTQLCIFLAMSHDIGKITPVMISKTLYGDAVTIKERLQDAGFAIPQYSSFGTDRSCIFHTMAGETILYQLEVPDSVAVVVGSHHGTPQSSSFRPDIQTEIYPYNYFGSYNSTDGKESAWRGLWSEWVNFSLFVSGFSSVSAIPELDMEPEMVLAGLLMMTEWISSNTALFPLISVNRNVLKFSPEELKDRVENAWQLIRLPAPLLPKNHYNLHDFDVDFGFKANAMQSRVIDVLSESEYPSLLIIEAPMESGKTEAALSAAEIMADKCGCGGIFFGLPLYSTANAISSRLLEWSEKQSEETKRAIKLALSHANLNSNCISLIPADNGTFASEDSSKEDIIKIEGSMQALLENFTIGTVDQFLLAGVKQKSVMIRHLGLCGKVVILDEVNSYDPCMNEYMDVVLSWLGQYRTPVIILSIALPKSRRNEIIKAYTGAQDCDYVVQKTDKAGYPLITWTDGTEIKQTSIYDDEKQTIYIEKGN